MCVPQTLAAFQALNTVSQNLVQSKHAQEQQNATARNNQILAEQKAKEQRRAGSIEAKKKQIEAAQKGSQLRNHLASSGVETTTGTALRMAQDIAEQGDIEAQDALNHAERSARQNDNAANKYKAQQRNSKWDLGQTLYNTGNTFLSNRNIFGRRGLLRF